jgi:hypothetical protein
MKKVMKRIWTLGLLLMISVVASAQEPPVKVDLNESYTGGTVVVSGYDTSAGDGSVVVTITVSPAEGYKIAKSDILVVSTVPASGTREGSPSIADNLQLNGNDPENLSDKRDYTFTVPSGLGAWVKEANFSEVGEQPQPGPQPQPQEPTTNISAEGSDLKWDYAEDTGTLVITGTGSTMNFGGEGSDPLASIRAQITSVVIGEGVTSLGTNLFAGCDNLTSITINNASQVLTLGENAIPANVLIKVPFQLQNEYWITEGWNNFKFDSEGATKMDITFGANNKYDAFAAGKEAVIVPSVLDAYTITGIDGNNLVLTKVDVITPNMAALVYNKRNLENTDFVTATTSAEPSRATNLLQVALEKQEVKLGEVFILHNDVFYYSQAGTIPAGGIYMTNPEPASTRSYYSLGGDGTTAIDPIYINKVEPHSAWYTLDGRQLPTAPSQKGIYINNGKKVVIK